MDAEHGTISRCRNRVSSWRHIDLDKTRHAHFSPSDVVDAANTIRKSVRITSSCVDNTMLLARVIYLPPAVVGIIC
jgi:hypothetical protein